MLDALNAPNTVHGHKNFKCTSGFLFADSHSQVQSFSGKCFLLHLSGADTTHNKSMQIFIVDKY